MAAPVAVITQENVNDLETVNVPIGSHVDMRHVDTVDSMITLLEWIHSRQPSSLSLTECWNRQFTRLFARLLRDLCPIPALNFANADPGKDAVFMPTPSIDLRWLSPNTTLSRLSITHHTIGEMDVSGFAALDTLFIFECALGGPVSLPPSISNVTFDHSTMEEVRFSPNTTVKSFRMIESIAIRIVNMPAVESSCTVNKAEIYVFDPPLEAPRFSGFLLVSCDQIDWVLPLCHNLTSIFISLHRNLDLSTLEAPTIRALALGSTSIGKTFYVKLPSNLGEIQVVQVHGVVRIWSDCQPLLCAHPVYVYQDMHSDSTADYNQSWSQANGLYFTRDYRELPAGVMI